MKIESRNMAEHVRVKGTQSYDKITGSRKVLTIN